MPAGYSNWFAVCKSGFVQAAERMTDENITDYHPRADLDLLRYTRVSGEFVQVQENPSEETMIGLLISCVLVATLYFVLILAAGAQVEQILSDRVRDLAVKAEREEADK